MIARIYTPEETYDFYTEDTKGFYVGESDVFIKMTNMISKPIARKLKLLSDFVQGKITNEELGRGFYINVSGFNREEFYSYTLTDTYESLSVESRKYKTVKKKFKERIVNTRHLFTYDYNEKKITTGEILNKELVEDVFHQGEETSLLQSMRNNHYLLPIDFNPNASTNANYIYNTYEDIGKILVEDFAGEITGEVDGYVPSFNLSLVDSMDLIDDELRRALSKINDIQVYVPINLTGHKREFLIKEVIRKRNGVGIPCQLLDVGGSDVH